MKKIAVVLCGSGYKDGSEIRESVGALWALSKHGAEIQCFALNEKQMHVVNCLTGEEAPNEQRNQLVESARIARGKIATLEELNVNDWDGILLPGGFGAAKNLCNYAVKGTEGSVHPKVQQNLKDFFIAGKPIGAICIAPIIVAMAFPNQGFELTVGADNPSVADIQKLGHHHIDLPPNLSLVDRKHKIVTSPAYMYDSAPLHEIFEGIESAVISLLDLA